MKPGTRTIAQSLAGLGEEPEIITATSVPNHDAWGPDEYWGCSDWVAWHKAMVEEYGQEEANQRFKHEWDQAGPFDHVITACRWNTQIVEYLMSQGIDISSALSAIILPLLRVGKDLSEGTQDASIGITDTVRTLKSLLPIAAVGLVAAGGYYVYQNYLKEEKK